MCFLPVTVINRNKKLPAKAIYCANHTSFLDIPTLYRSIPGFFSIIGKEEVAKMPLIGYVFKNLYVTVKRDSAESRRQSLIKCKQTVKEGRSMVLFPEGRINSAIAPQLSPFQDGAFLLAIDQQIPIVPVTIPNNWLIFPGNQKYLAQGKIKVVLHEPISTIGLTIADLPVLKQQVYAVIEKELNECVGHVDR